MQQLVIGYGNTLRGDDGIGVLLADRIAARVPALRVITAHQLTPEFAEPISQARQVIFIDAGLDGEPGEVRVERVAAIDQGGIFTHTSTPAGLLASAGLLYGHAPVAFLVTVTGADFELGERLSPAVSAVIPVALATIERLLSP